MGLMIQFPVSTEEADRIELNNNSISLKSYGLPLIFWGYLLAILTVVFAMALAVKGPIVRLYETGDTINQAIVIGASLTMFLIPAVMLCFFFYEKVITKSNTDLRVTHKIFWIPLYTKKYTLKSPGSFEVKHFMDSPNVAKMQGSSELRGFENKGYFQLFLTTSDNKLLFLDRHSRKADLVKLKELLSKY